MVVSEPLVEVPPPLIFYCFFYLNTLIDSLSPLSGILGHHVIGCKDLYLEGLKLSVLVQKLLKRKVGSPKFLCLEILIKNKCKGLINI